MHPFSTTSSRDLRENHLEQLIAEVGTLAEGMNGNSSQSLSWYLMSVELHKACLRMRAAHAEASERSRRLAELSVTRRMKVSLAHRGPALGLGRGGN